jgi:argininosuccinate lyase
MKTTYIVTETQRRLDLTMVPYDIWGTRAHVTMLKAVGVLTGDELAQILDALAAIEAEVEVGDYAIDPSLGAQMTLEREITRRTGPAVGGKVHTGRSRNDQVLTAQRLFQRDQLLTTVGALLDALAPLLALAEAHVATVMPGYTHIQPAKPTTFGQWCLAYVDMFRRDVDRLQQTYRRFNVNPLGAAESYGTSWPLDRALTAQLLAFDGVQEIPLDAVATRGEMAAELLGDLALLNLHLSKLAQDLLLFNTFEFGMVELGETVAQRMGKVTGSSIMPQKKNPDVLELLRANASVVYARHFETLEVLKALPFGYNRDSRESKAAVTEGLKRTLDGLRQLPGLLESLIIDADRMRQAVVENYSLATDLADYLAQHFGLPYRSAYTVVGTLVKEAIAADCPLHAMDVARLQALARDVAGVEIALSQAAFEAVLEPERALAQRQHVGGAAPAEMARLIAARWAAMEQDRAWLTEREQAIAKARAQAVAV